MSWDEDLNPPVEDLNPPVTNKTSTKSWDEDLNPTVTNKTSTNTEQSKRDAAKAKKKARMKAIKAMRESVMTASIVEEERLKKAERAASKAASKAAALSAFKNKFPKKARKAKRESLMTASIVEEEKLKKAKSKAALEAALSAFKNKFRWGTTVPAKAKKKPRGAKGKLFDLSSQIEKNIRYKCDPKDQNQCNEALDCKWSSYYGCVPTDIYNDIGWTGWNGEDAKNYLKGVKEWHTGQTGGTADLLIEAVSSQLGEPNVTEKSFEKLNKGVGILEKNGFNPRNVKDLLYTNKYEQLGGYRTVLNSLNSMFFI